MMTREDIHQYGIKAPEAEETGVPWRTVSFFKGVRVSRAYGVSIIRAFFLLLDT